MYYLLQCCYLSGFVKRFSPDRVLVSGTSLHFKVAAVISALRAVISALHVYGCRCTICRRLMGMSEVCQDAWRTIPFSVVSVRSRWIPNKSSSLLIAHGTILEKKAGEVDWYGVMWFNQCIPKHGFIYCLFILTVRDQTLGRGTCSSNISCLLRGVKIFASWSSSSLLMPSFTMCGRQGMRNSIKSHHPSLIVPL